MGKGLKVSEEGQSQRGQGKEGQSQQSQSRGRDRAQEQQANPLQTERGNTTIQNPVVSRIVGLAAQEIEGIRMGGAGSQTASGVLGGITGSSGQTRGVSTEVGQEEVAADLTLTVEYGRSVAQLAQSVRQNVINRVEMLTGLNVAEVNVDVVDVYFPQAEEAEQLEEGGERAG